MLVKDVLEQCAAASLDHILDLDEALLAAEPRVRDFVDTVRLRVEAAQQVDLTIVAGPVADALGVAQILAVHDYDVVEALEVRGMKLSCDVLDLETAPTRDRHGACVRSVPDVVGGRPRGIDVEAIGQAGFPDELKKH